MKVVIVNGQNHRGSTYHAGRMIADKLADENKRIFSAKRFL